jgi:hypothetical protein
MFNSKKEYSDKMIGNHFEHLHDGPKGKVQRTPRGTYFVKCRSLLKFLTAKNGLFLGANRVVVTNVPSRLHSNDVMSFAPRISHFLLKL